MCRDGRKLPGEVNLCVHARVCVCAHECAFACVWATQPARTVTSLAAPLKSLLVEGRSQQHT